MAIKYDSSYNARIARIVKNFNERRRRAFMSGVKNIPQAVKVRDLKIRNRTRRDLEKELKALESFTVKDKPARDFTTPGGVVTNKWQLKYLKMQAPKAREYYLREYKILAPKVGRMPGERMKLNETSSKLALLDTDIEELTPTQFEAYVATVNEFMGVPSKIRGGYKGFLIEVVNVMRLSGIDEKEINKVMDKLKELDFRQFQKLYEESDLINRFYELADSPIYGGGLKLNTSESNARELSELLVEQIDDLVEKAKEEPVYEFDPIKDFGNLLLQEKYMKPEFTPEGRIKRSSLTKEQAEKLEEAGLGRVIDENQ